MRAARHKVIWLLAGAFGRRLRLFHLFRHFGFHGIEVEARAALHRRVFDEGLECFADDLLDEHETPELELEPIEVLLRPSFVPLRGQPLICMRQFSVLLGFLRASCSDTCFVGVHFTCIQLRGRRYSRSMTTFSLPSFTAFIRTMWSRSL